MISWRVGENNRLLQDLNCSIIYYLRFCINKDSKFSNKFRIHTVTSFYVNCEHNRNMTVRGHTATLSRLLFGQSKLLTNFRSFWQHIFQSQYFTEFSVHKVCVAQFQFTKNILCWNIISVCWKFIFFHYENQLFEEMDWFSIIKSRQLMADLGNQGFCSSIFN